MAGGHRRGNPTVTTDTDTPRIRSPEVENDDLRERLRVAEDTLQAIRNGQVDSLIARTPQGLRVFTLEEAHAPYRLFVDEMQQGAATVDARGTILYCNRSLPLLLRIPRERVIGAHWPDLVAEEDAPKLAELMNRAAAGRAWAELSLRAADGTIVPVSVTANPLTTLGTYATCLVVTDLTERRDAERQLQLQAARYAAIQDTTADGYYVLGADLRFLEVNDAFCRLSGYSRDEVLRLSMPSFDAVMSSEEVAAHVRQCRERGFGRVETRYRARDGHLIDLDISFSYVAGLDQFVVFLRDIGERKRAEAALRRAADYNRSLIEASLDPLVTIGADGKIADVNAATEAVTGRARAALIGTDFSDYFTRPELAEAGYQRVFREGVVRDYPLEIRHTDGHTTPVLYNASVYRDASGAVVGVFASARDITQLKKAEAERLSLFRLIDLAHDAIFIRSEGGRISYWNEGAERVYGWTRAEAVGRDSHDLLKTVFPRPLHDLEAAMKAHGAWEGELTHTRRDGCPVIVASRWVLDPDPRRGPGSFQILEINSEITARKVAEDEFMELHAQLEERVHDRTAQLEETNKELEAFCYAVSHDLRAPLRSIDGFTLALVEDYAPGLDDQARHFCQRIRSATQKMGHLIDDLLRLSRTTRGELNVGVVDLTAIAWRIANELRAAEPERQVAFLIAPELRGNGDAQLLEVVLENLLDNAWKFTGKHKQATIEFGADWREGQSAYFVRDDGAGFDMSTADRLFTPFQRMHIAAEFPGNGIGLATVKRIIQRHGGKIWAESAVERGATFHFTLGSPDQHLGSELRRRRDRSAPGSPIPSAARADGAPTTDS